MVQKWQEGYDVVYGVRSKRLGENMFKLLTAKAFYRILNKLSDFDMPTDSGDFRLMDRKVVDVLRSLEEQDRYLRGLIPWIGFRQLGLSYERDKRFAGETKYPLKKMFKLASDAITGFSYFPLRLATYLGLAAAGTGLLALLILIILRLM